MVDVFLNESTYEEDSFETISSDINNNWRDVYNDSCDFNIETLDYTDDDFHDFDHDINADNNFFNQIGFDCRYYTDDQFKAKIRVDKGLPILHINCRSLNANFSKLEDYLNALDYNFDVIAVSETWLSLISNTELCYLPGYDLCHKDRKNKRGGGVALYIKTSLKYKVVDRLSIVEDDGLECISIDICLHNKKNVIVSCLYRQPGSSIRIMNDTLENV